MRGARGQIWKLCMLSKNNFFLAWLGLHAFVIVSRDVLKFILDELRQGLLSILEKGLQQWQRGGA